jgi:hypothetical protein
LSLEDAAASGLTVVSGAVDGGCCEPDDFFSDVVFETPALAPSAAASVPWPCCGCTDDDPAAEPDGVVPAGPVAKPEGVVVVDPVTEPEGAVPVDPVATLDGVVPVDLVATLDGVVPVDLVAEPDGVEVVLDVVEVSEAGTAHATPGAREIADPIPKATANATTRPT